jgi:CHAT domain-containing protein
MKLYKIAARPQLEFSDFKKVQNISWKDIQAGLKENEVAIEFLHFSLFNPDSSLTDFTNTTQYLALIVTPTCKTPEMLPLFIEKDLENMLGKFSGNNYSYINGIYGKNTEAKTELYNIIWKPMEESLKDVKTVYLSPTGLLHKISFAAIAKEQNIYLCDNYNIEVKSSTGKITESEDFARSETLANATLFGGITYDIDSIETQALPVGRQVWSYLEGTKTETEKINQILENGKIKVNYFTNTTATEENFKLMANNSNILHIATHGFFYPDPKETKIEVEKKQKVEYGDVIFRGSEIGFGVNSFVKNPNPLMRSGLVFAGANNVWSKQEKAEGDDGVLTAQEVAHIDMRKTDLVVMSACETGLGDIRGSEGVYGLQRAFKMAGANYLIMSLWQVPDKETVEFMTIFYTKLLVDKNINKAFKETQKAMRQKYDPYYWAAFVLIE